MKIQENILELGLIKKMSLTMRLLLFLSSLLSLAACVSTNPFTENKTHKPDNKMTVKKAPSRIGQEPVMITTLTGNPMLAAACLETAIQNTFKIPADFISNTKFANHTRTLSLINPATEQVGISIDLSPQDQNTIASMHDNGTVVSAAWKKLLKQCE